MLAVMRDSAGQLLLAGYGFAPSESEHSWTWFLEHLRAAHAALSKDDYVFVSDRDKGLQNAVETVFPRGFHRYACPFVHSLPMQENATRALP